MDAPGEAAVQRANILLVDDQPARLMSYQAILGQLQQNLVCARSGEEALRCVLDREFALIILDVSMPGMDGFETAAMIHEHPRFEQTPIIFVTGVHDSEFDRLKGYELGAVDYVSIPVVPEILRSKVSVLVELHNKRHALQRLNQELASMNERLTSAHQSLLIEKNAELESVNAHLLRANGQLEDLNSALQMEVAERARAEEALRQADRQKDEFLAILAHELRNPLAPMRNAVEIMRQTDAPEESLTYARNVIDRQLVHISRLMDDLLDIARVTKGTIRLEMSDVPVGLIVDRSLETVRPALDKCRHEVVLDLGDTGWSIAGDLTRLVQIVGNLLSNAAKYTPEGGRIELRARRTGNHVELCVKDNGIGIAADSMPMLFSLFSRVGAADHGMHDGLGVGLALVRKLVELHRGEVWVRSDGPSKGSEFYVRLPLAEPAGPVRGPPTGVAATETVAALTAPPNAMDTEPWKMLIADDNRDALDSLAMLLQLSGYEVIKASNGVDALDLARRHRPKLMLLDIGMPGYDGYEVARRSRGESWAREATLLAVSGWGQPDDVARALAAGFDGHVVKPIDFSVLDRILAERGLMPPHPS